MVDPRINTAGFSLRECAKQLALLEDHLAHASKRCPDCIHKHTLAAEGFAEEALTLDGASRFSWAQGIPAGVRSINCHADARSIRKTLSTRLRAEGLGSVGPPVETSSGMLTKIAVVLVLWRIFA